MMVNKKSQVGVIGAGPAGCAAAIQLKRYGLEVILIDRDKIGGLVRNANFVENYLGFPKGISGVEFCYTLEEHLKHLEVETVKDEIVSLDWDKSQDEFIAKSKKNQYNCQYLVIATGTKPRRLNLKGEVELWKNGLLFYEPAKMLEKLFFNKKIAIIGSGDAAFDYAINLANRENHITIITRTKDYKSLPLLVKRATDNKLITIKPNQVIKEFSAKKEKEEIHPIVKTKSKDEIVSDFILVAVGRDPNHLPSEVKLDKFIKDKRLFFIGDLVSENNRQISIASGHGIRCAMDIAKEILNI
ncbi:MAG: NAD(P)/FAD-dependent oxidoreductase [Candidatus Heimdallarchaeota archaeon]|nr:NAD(P)/FAD-dependent oxidoreductase [Candidatus Heimdallarchaeota archaeon]